jgi:flagellin-like hook-associated protein FlgL
MRLNAKRAGVTSIPYRSPSSSQDAFIRDTRTGPTYSERASSASALSENLDTSERLSAALTNLTYVRDLLTQARDIGLQATGTESERSALSGEANQLISQANSILKSSSYSNKSVFNPANPSVTLRTGLSGRRSEEFTLVDAQVVTPGSGSVTPIKSGAADYNLSSLATASDGSFYVVGGSLASIDGQTNAGVTDALISKYMSDGSKAWTRLIGTANNEFAFDVASDSSGSVYVAGTTSGNLDGISNSHQGRNDGFLKKFSSDGSAAWTRLIRSSPKNTPKNQS